MARWVGAWVPSAVAVLVLVGAFAWGARHTRRGVEVGDLAPDYSAVDLEGREVAIAEFRGRPLLLNVWATWCGPCRVEMPSIQQLYEAYRERGFVVLGVSVDASHAEGAIREFVKEYALSFPILHDPANRVGTVFLTRGVPETIVLDGAGRIVKRVSGAADWNSPGNRALIEHLLTGP